MLKWKKHCTCLEMFISSSYQVANAIQRYWPQPEDVTNTQGGRGVCELFGGCKATEVNKRITGQSDRNYRANSLKVWWGKLRDWRASKRGALFIGAEARGCARYIYDYIASGGRGSSAGSRSCAWRGEGGRGCDCYIYIYINMSYF